MAYTIRRNNNYTNFQENRTNSNSKNKNVKELSDYIPCYDDFNNIIGFKKYTISLINNKVFVNFFDSNKKFFLRKKSELDKTCFYEKFGIYAL